MEKYAHSQRQDCVLILKYKMFFGSYDVFAVSQGIIFLEKLAFSRVSKDFLLLFLMIFVYNGIHIYVLERKDYVRNN